MRFQKRANANKYGAFGDARDVPSGLQPYLLPSGFRCLYIYNVIIYTYTCVLYRYALLTFYVYNAFLVALWHFLSILFNLQPAKQQTLAD